MKRRFFRYLSLGLALLLALCTVACDLSAGGLIGELIQGPVEDLFDDLPGQKPSREDKDDEEDDEFMTDIEIAPDTDVYVSGSMDVTNAPMPDTWPEFETAFGSEIESETGLGIEDWFGSLFDTTSEPETETETEIDWISKELLSYMGLQGKDIVILANNATDVSYEYTDTSDPLDAAVYQRDEKIQSFYGVNLRPVVEPDYLALSQTVKNDVLSCSGEYHIVYQHMVDAATNLGMGSCLYDLTELEYVNFDNPWWDRNCTNGFMIGDQMMMACGDLLPSSMMITSAVLFNKTQFDERGMEYPYADAREGTWTLDDMLLLTKDQNRDLNGDAKMTYTDDFYGLVGWSLDCDYTFFFGAGATMFMHDDEHLPVYTPVVDRLESVYEKIYDLIITQQAFHVTLAEYHANNSMYQEPTNVFKQGRALFFAGYLSAGTGLREMENEFGILPQPKYDEKQEDYLSFVNGAASVVCVPGSLYGETLDDVGYMMEVLASTSYYMVTDNLYNKVAKSKYSRDPESAEMVNIIIRNRVFDFGYVFFHNKALPCASIIQTALNNKSPSISKDIAKGEKQTIRALKKVYEAYGYEYSD